MSLGETSHLRPPYITQTGFVFLMFDSHHLKNYTRKLLNPVLIKEGHPLFNLSTPGVQWSGFLDLGADRVRMPDEYFLSELKWTFIYKEAYQ